MTESPAEFWENLYAGRAAAEGRPNVLLAGLVPGLPPGRALDLGCAHGADALHLAGNGWTVTATDISPTAVRRTAEAAVRAGLADRVVAEVHDLAVSFPEGEFDLVSAQYFQTPFEFPRAEVLRRAAGALAPGGLLFVVDHGSVAPWSWKRDPEPVFPTPEELFAGFGLDSADFKAERLEAPRRTATGPNGETAEVVDTVVLVRRL